MNIKINIKVNHHHFTATLDDTPSAQAFKAMLPLTMKMVELNGNEKYFRLLSNLPVDTFHPEVIHEGDLMLWGSNTLVLFYETFSTSYSYTHIGKIDNPTGLAKTLGKGSVEVIFEIP